ncbi:hypothetical protein BGX34_000397 [Mortierella sp. NVP85]|nr:hypothetical protein BGX34_000397 [Mortierella sp. NVP85]
MLLGLVSDASSAIPIQAIKTALPIGIGLASAAYLAMKIASNSSSSGGETVPMASLRPGDSTHDNEYNEDQDAFLQRCEEEYGSTFSVLLLGRTYTIVSGPLISEVIMNNDFSSHEATDDLLHVNAYFNLVRKSNLYPDHRTLHALVKDNITPHLSIFTPRIVEQLEKNLDRELSKCPVQDGGRLVKDPLIPLHEMVGSAMADVFVGPEVAKSRKVIDAFIHATEDFAKMLGNGNIPHATFWGSLVKFVNYKFFNSPLHIHLQTLVDASVPVVLERRRQEAKAAEKGVEYERPNDILQRMLDNVDKYGFIDLEDVCGHILILILASVHTTTDWAAALLYFFAAFPEYLETLYKEQKDVLDEIQQEREQKREELKKKGEPIDEELDPAHDRDLTAAAIKRMVRMDSFVREMFRFRTERLTLMHRARKSVALSNGVVIAKGQSAICNLKSAHQGPEQGDEATEFRPWRFLGKPKTATKVGADFLPFGRFLAIQELKTIGVLVVSKYSKIEIQDPSKTMKSLRTRMGDPVPTGVIMTSRV